MNTGKIYIIATPIGNLGDITLRALETLKSVDLILAEDTRVTKKILMHYDIKTNIKSYHQHSSENIKFEILNMLNNGQNLALVTDAGTPGISDPGNELLDFLYHANPQISAIPIPGASSPIVAASVSGFNMSKFIFLGYFPKKHKTRYLKLISDSKLPIIYFDSPQRLLKNLGYLADNQLENRQVLIARELTKLHEELYRGTLSEVIEQLKTENPKGEAVVIIGVPGKNRTSI